MTIFSGFEFGYEFYCDFSDRLLVNTTSDRSWCDRTLSSTFTTHLTGNNKTDSIDLKLDRLIEDK